MFSLVFSSSSPLCGFVATSVRPSFLSCILCSICCFRRGLWTFCTRCSSRPLTNKSRLTANCCRRCLQIRHILTTAITQKAAAVRAANPLSGQLAKACEITPQHLLTFRGLFTALYPGNLLSSEDHQPLVVYLFTVLQPRNYMQTFAKLSYCDNPITIVCYQCKHNHSMCQKHHFYCPQAIYLSKVFSRCFFFLAFIAFRYLNSCKKVHI